MLPRIEMKMGIAMTGCALAVLTMAMFLSCCSANGEVTDSWLRCVESMEFPALSSGMPYEWLGGLQGTAEALVVVGSDGTASIQSVRAPSPALRAFLMGGLSKAHFRVGCAGKTLRVPYDIEAFDKPVALSLPSVGLEGGSRIKLKCELEGPSGPLRIRPR